MAFLGNEWAMEILPYFPDVRQFCGIVVPETLSRMIIVMQCIHFFVKAPWVAPLAVWILGHEGCSKFRTEVWVRVMERCGIKMTDGSVIQ